MRRGAFLLLLLLVPLGFSARSEPPVPSEPPAAEAFLLEVEGLRELGPASLIRRPSRFPYRVGERIDYDVSWWGIAVGRASLEIARLVEWRGLRLAHVVATARTNEFFSLFYRVDDRSESWIDIDALRTVRTASLTRHAEKETWEEVEFDWQTHLIHVVEEKRHVGRIKVAVLDAGPFVYDTFDVFYALRSLPLELGQGAELPIYASRKIYGLHVDVERRETVVDPVLGELEALVLRPYDSLGGAPQEDGAGEVWVTADAPHVPIRLRGWFRTVGERLRVGGVRVALAGFDPGAPGWPAARFETRPALEWPARSAGGEPVWELPAEVKRARETAGLAPDKGVIDGVLAPLRECRDRAATRRWARLALASTPCSPPEA